jgi:hypothetical protein
MDKVQNPSNSECYTPSSEPFRFYLGMECALLNLESFRVTRNVNAYYCLIVNITALLTRNKTAMYCKHQHKV